MDLQKDASASFNTLEDSGINAKFVNAVYDALLNTVSIIYEHMQIVQFFDLSVFEKQLHNYCKTHLVTYLPEKL